MPFWRESKNFLKGHFLRPRKSSQKTNEPTADNLNRVGSKGSDQGSANFNTSTSKEPFDPWLEAQQVLRKDEKLNKIWEESIRILKSRLGLEYEDDGNATRVNDLRTFLDVVARRLDDKKWSFLDDIGESDTRKRLTEVCRKTLLVKEVISPAAATSPPAAIACAGITVGLLATEQHETLLQGLDTVSSLVPRLHVIEHHFLQSDANFRADLRRTIEKDMVQLCSKVLEFQSRAICYLEKQTVRQFFTDMLKQDGWDEILQDIKRYDTSIKAATSSVHASEVVRKLDGLQNDLQQMQVWQTTSVKDQKKATLFQRLYTCPYKDRKDRNNKRVPRTCEWFTSHPQFTKWNQSRNSELLWVSADPGCGKSVLTRYLADEYLPSGTRTVCYFFFKDDYVDQGRATVALASILRQLLIAQPHLVQDPLLNKSETSGDQLVESFNELWSILVHVTADKNAGEVICLFDALDECQDDDRTKLIQAIESLFLNKSGKRNLKFLMTSRPYDYIRRDFFRLEKSLPTIHLSGENEENTDKISGEIDLVIKERVKDIGERNSLQQDEVDFIIKQLTLVPNRTYLWVSLALDVIKGVDDFSRGNVRKVIRDIPENVNAAYTQILDRSPDHSRARRLLHIVTAAERPLTLPEISLALAFSTKDQSTADIQDKIQTDDERIKKLIRGLCGLFLVVIDGKVYLFHQTAKEFLVRQSQNSVIEDTKAGTWKHSLYPEESHYVLADICTLYLCQETTRDMFPGLMDYAAENWAAHFRRASVSSDDTITKRGRMLCQPNSSICKAWTTIYKRKDWYFVSEFDDILIASYLGLTAVTKLLLETGNVDIESKDRENGKTPLSWAAENGHEGVVKLLLETEIVDVESKDAEYGQTPLSWAAWNGHEGVIKLLLETKKVDVESKDSHGRTPLSWAAENGQKGVVKLLLETGTVDVNSKDSHGQTPLYWAAANKHEGVVKLLLETGKVDVESRDFNGRAPLSWAAWNKYEVVVKLLLETGMVDVESKDSKYGLTPLSWAAWNGHEGVVKLLFETGKVDVDFKDFEGKTPLSWAAENGHKGVVKLLLETGKVDVESKDAKYGRTPLFWAAWNGHKGVVKLLLETGKLNVDFKDSNCRTPLSWAAENGHEGVVRMLLETGMVDVESTDAEYGRTPLSWAAENGHKEVVKLLLETGKVDVESKDTKYGQTPLSWAARSGHEGVVKQLFETGKVDIESRDSNSQTPLSWAAWNGHEGVVKLLLETGMVDIDSKDFKYGLTPLSWAAEYGQKGVVKLLLETGEVDMESKDSHGQTPLSWAAEYGHEGVVELLLETGKVDVESRDSHGRTPLSWAAWNGHEGVIKLLLETKKVDVESKDSHGRTPLSWAAENGHNGVVELLLETGKVDMESKDAEYGRTPLSWAVWNGHEGVVKLLLETGKVDVESKDSHGRTLLSWAAENGHKGVVKLLLETGKVDIELKESHDRTPLSWAAENGHKRVVRLLLATGKVDVESKDADYDQTPLSWAARNGHREVVKLLLKTGKVDVESKDSNGRTPLSWAAENGHEGIVELLLETGKVDGESKDSHGRTPLYWAAENGHEGVVKLLQDAGLEVKHS